VTPSPEVLNQSPPLEGYNPFTDDKVLVEAVERAGGGWSYDRIESLGRICGGDAVAWGFDANAHVPELKTHDRNGVRIDEVEFHPS
jgi:putative acyl-CoA dehydrogenase